MSASASDQVDELIWIAAELVGTVHDYGPDAVAGVLARVPDRRHDALAVVLAAMVDPDQRPAELLAWIEGPVRSRDDGAAPTPSRPSTTCPACGRAMRASSLRRHITRKHPLRKVA